MCDLLCFLLDQHWSRCWVCGSSSFKERDHGEAFLRDIKRATSCWPIRGGRLLHDERDGIQKSNLWCWESDKYFGVSWTVVWKMLVSCILMWTRMFSIILLNKNRQGGVWVSTPRRRRRPRSLIKILSASWNTSLFNMDYEGEWVKEFMTEIGELIAYSVDWKFEFDLPLNRFMPRSLCFC